MARVLYVDDEQDMATYVALALTNEAPDVEVRTRRGAQHVTTDDCEWATLLLADWDLPDGSGEEVVDRALSINPGLRVVVLSGHLEPTQRWRCVRKPISIDELLEAIR